MKVGVEVRCGTCGRQKQPHGRSAPLGHGLCDSDCPGYNQEPKPGCLWPGETERDFGFPVCAHATKEQLA